MLVLRAVLVVVIVRSLLELIQDWLVSRMFHVNVDTRRCTMRMDFELTFGCDGMFLYTCVRFVPSMLLDCCVAETCSSECLWNGCIELMKSILLGSVCTKYWLSLRRPKLGTSSAICIACTIAPFVQDLVGMHIPRCYKHASVFRNSPICSRMSFFVLERACVAVRHFSKVSWLFPHMEFCRPSVWHSARCVLVAGASL